MLKQMSTLVTPFRVVVLGIFVVSLLACTPTQQLGSSSDSDDGRIEIAFLQMNDVYEIDGVEGGRSGGLARVAHLYETIQEKHPQSMMVLAGDFLNPSLIGTLRHEGERIRGRQMVEVLNAAGLDLVAFGNHEFDISEADLQQRIDESTFDWIATNIQQVCGDRLYPFYKEVDGRKAFIPTHKVYSFTDSDGTRARVGIVSATLDSNPRDYVEYMNWDSCAAIEMDLMKDKTDIVIGLTHLAIGQDMEFARNVPGLPLIMGGHEHHNMRHEVGETIIAKADANARTVYLHVLDCNMRTGEVSVSSELIDVNHEIPKDPEVDEIVRKWTTILEADIRKIIPNPYEVVYTADEPLDGRESTIRFRQSNMGKLFCDAMLASSQAGATAAIMNSGSIRIDDQMEGEIVAMDIFRALPFGGSVNEITVGGNLLFGILRYGANATDNGAYLQYSGIEFKDNEWFVNGNPLDKEGKYTIALNDFLLRGLDIPFLTEENTGVINVFKPDGDNKEDLRNDIRGAIIAHLKSM